MNFHFIILLSFVFTGINAQFDCSNLAIGFDFNAKTPLGELQENGLTSFFGGNLDVFYLGVRSDNFIFAPGGTISYGTTKFKYGETTALEFPVGGTATERLSVEQGDLTAAFRVIYTKPRGFSPYAEIYTGLRATFGFDRLQLDQDLEGYENTSTKLFQNGSSFRGIAIGGLFQISKSTSINFKVSKEWTNEILHLDIATSDSYSTTTIATENTTNLGFNIGFFYVPGCPETRRRSSRCGSRSYYRPYRIFSNPRSFSNPRRARSVTRT